MQNGRTQYPRNGRAHEGPPAASAAQGNAERLTVFTIVEREGNAKPFWRAIGSAFINRDGSINCYLDAAPLNGRINIRRPDRRENDADRDSREYRD